MQQAVDYIGGTLELEITGPFPERFLNICAQNGVAFSGLSKKDGVMRVYMSPRAFKKLRPLARRCQCHVHIVKKTGVPFFLWRFRNRYALLLGGVLFLGLLYYASLFVWEVEVTGNETVPTEVILKNLADVGVKPGVYGADIRSETGKNEMLLRVGDLSWLAVNISGSRASVEVRERTPQPDIIPLNTPCNVIAGRAGVISAMDVLAGAQQVMVGETVSEGQLLVSGFIDSAELGVRMVHAMASVRARTWYELNAATLTEMGEKRYTGESRTRYAVVFGGVRINLYFDAGIPYVHCDKITQSTRLRLPGGLSLPIELVTEQMAEYSLETVERSVQEMELSLRQALEREVEERTGGEIQSHDFTTYERPGQFLATMISECEEQIAVTHMIPEKEEEDRQEQS